MCRNEFDVYNTGMAMALWAAARSIRQSGRWILMCHRSIPSHRITLAVIINTLPRYVDTYLPRGRHLCILLM
jgi:hypothetical protein